MSKTILVTGGAGFIGSHLCRRLRDDGHRVISLDNYFTGVRENHEEGVEYREGHTKDIERLVPESPDIVYHLGEYARTEKSFEDVEMVWDLNSVGTFAVLEFVRRRRSKIVYAGSSTKFADGGLGRDQNPYAWSKAANTELVKNYAAWFGIPYAITYFYNVYGPRERAGAFGTLIEIYRQSYLAGLPLGVVAPGTQRRNFTHVDDIINGLILVGEKGERGEYGLGHERSYSVQEVADLFGSETVVLPTRPGNRFSSDIDISRARALGWNPERTLEAYIEEFKKTATRAVKCKKRVLIFSLNYYPRFIGGAEVAIKEITDRINPEEVEFHMVTLRIDSALSKVEQIGNVLVHRIGFTKKNPSIDDLKHSALHYNKYLYQLAAAWKALSLHAQYKYDGIWAMMAHPCGIPAGIFKFFNPKVRYLLTLQEGDPPEAIERMMTPVFPLFKAAFTRAEHLQVISTFLLSWGKRLGFKGDGVVIPNAVDTARFGAVAPRGNKEGEVRLVTTSRLVHKNALDDVIRALALLPEKVVFVIYGIGPDEEKLKALAAELKVSDRVRFMGHIGHDTMPAALADADIFIRPSRSEGMGNSFVEAMSAGLPVIATQEGGIADFLFDAKRNPGKEATGWAVDTDAPEQIAAAVTEIMAGGPEVAATVARAKNLVQERYDWNLIANGMRILFIRMLQDKLP